MFFQKNQKEVDDTIQKYAKNWDIQRMVKMDKDILPKATFVVNSGTGLHLYYVLDEPVPMYPQNQLYMKELKYALTRQIWNRFTSSELPQNVGI